MTAAESVPGFEWFPGIPARNAWAYGHVGDVSVKITHLTVLRLVMVEEIGPDRLPTRTLMTVEADGVTVENLERFLDTIGVRP